ncbi:MAG: DUF1622 domain-containing protein [Chloroflexi bacterium]|nr:DUF1622 domain-containing protein [Chloroflexota bacterium]
MHLTALEEIVMTAIHYVVPLVEACGAFVIMLGVIRTMVYHFRRLFSFEPECVARARLQLVESLVMGLEFQVAADVLKTAISPTWDDFLRLAALIALRTVLGFVLEREARNLCCETNSATNRKSEPAMTEV